MSYTWGEPACLIISMNGTKRTKDNIARTGALSATVVTQSMLPLVETLGGVPPADRAGLMAKMGYRVEQCRIVNAPLVSGANFSYECDVIRTVEIGSTHTYFAEIKQVNASDDILDLDFFDLRVIDPVVYSPGNYFAVGKHLGKIGDLGQYRN